MENKYYTPELEDMNLDYVCEKLTKSCWTNNIPKNSLLPYVCEERWVEHKIMSPPTRFGYSSERLNLEEGKIRTKFLDREDIESLGWKFKEFSSNLRRERFTILHKTLESTYYQLSFLSEEKGDIIIYEYFPAGNIALFQGECKSINELKKLMKWLKIN